MLGIFKNVGSAVGEGVQIDRARMASALLVGLLATGLPAQAAKYPWDSYEDRMKATTSPAALDMELFGDSVSLQNGALSFAVTDVSLPGNSKIPVQLTRRYQVINRKERISDGMLADWEFDIPRIEATFGDRQNNGTSDWLNQNGTAQRCSNFQYAPTISGFQRWDYWTGIQIHVPGGGGELLRSGWAL
jgi:hypothetical protein